MKCVLIDAYLLAGLVVFSMQIQLSRVCISSSRRWVSCIFFVRRMSQIRPTAVGHVVDDCSTKQEMIVRKAVTVILQG